MSTPNPLAKGVPMLKVSSKKIKHRIISLEADEIRWESRKGGKSRSD
jgi:hypothetical protein